VQPGPRFRSMSTAISQLPMLRLTAIQDPGPSRQLQPRLRAPEGSPPCLLSSDMMHWNAPQRLQTCYCCVLLLDLVQVRSHQAIQERMLRLTDPAAPASDQPAADALLCLSGSHPARKLPGSSRSVMTTINFAPFEGCTLAMTHQRHRDCKPSASDST
jgi:hypothetical protein